MSGMTFGQAKDFATGRMGDCCQQIADADWEVLMSNAFQTVLDSLSGASHPQAIVKFNAVIGQASYAFAQRPTQVELAGRILVAGEPFARYPGETALLAAPVLYSWEDGKLILTPAPDQVYEIEVHVEGATSTVLYTGTGNSKVWNPIPLPIPLHTMYAKLLAGLGLLDVDPARATNWMNLAMSEIQRWVEHQDQASTGKFRMNAVRLNRRNLGDGPQPFPGSPKRIQYVLPGD